MSTRTQHTKTASRGTLHAAGQVFVGSGFEACSGGGRRALSRLRCRVRLEVWPQAAQQLRLGHKADDPLDRLAALEQNHGRDTRDAKLHRRVLIFVDIQLDDLELAGLFDRDLLEHRSDHAARTAPLGPEIDQYRGLTLNLCPKGRVGDLCELSHSGHPPWEIGVFAVRGMGRYDVVSLCNTYSTPAIPALFWRIRQARVLSPAGQRPYTRPTAPKWRNWQTRYVQGVVGVLPS